MHPQLEILLQLQDLRAQRRELDAQGAGETTEKVESEIFQVDLARARDELDAKIREIEEHLEPVVRDRDRRLAAGRGRAVVPVIRGICYGCFMAVPSAVAAARDANETLSVCQNCGRFLYFIR
jgi:predicted  nucleic acid-binding Zn-ribbon protein